MLGGGEHAINSKKVDVKRAKAKPGKIFVGGLTTELQDDDIKSYFAKFGNVTECEMPFDKTKNARKNFCFVTFEREETMKELLKSPKQKIGEVEVDVKRATPKSGCVFFLSPIRIHLAYKHFKTSKLGLFWEAISFIFEPGGSNII